MFASKGDAAYATANAAWRILQPINNMLPAGKLPRPSWAPGPLLKERDRTPMDIGVPRKTLSLCPDCNREAVEAVLKGEIGAADFRDNPGIIGSAGTSDVLTIRMSTVMAKTALGQAEAHF